MKLHFLGTASCFPTPVRNVSCTCLQLSDGQVWMFDCGECTQVQVQKSKLKFGKISKIFITHLHGDHLFGLPGLLCSLGNGLDPELASKKVVDIYGPIGIKKYLITCLELSRSMPIFHCNVHELIPEADQYPSDWDEWKVKNDYDEDTVLKISSSRISSTKDDQGNRFWQIPNIIDHTIKAVAIKHRVPSFGYVIEEHDQPGALNVQKAKALGVIPGPDFGKLKNGEIVRTNNGAEIRPEQVLGDPIKGRKITILGDTCDTSEISNFSKNADYVVHEATMEDSLKEKAIEYGHSTPTMAAEFAVKVKARKLCLSHVSPRYKPIEETDTETTESVKILLLEAKAYLAKVGCQSIEVIVAKDFLEDTVQKNSIKK